MRILLISDIHGNYPALRTLWAKLGAIDFDYVINAGDSLVYAPFPNQTLNWLRNREAISILGNTDKKVLKLLKGKSFKKPSKLEKVRMYTSTANELSKKNVKYLRSFPKSTSVELSLPSLKNKNAKIKIGIFHGSPAQHHEFLFAATPDSRFSELASNIDFKIVVTGHSHSPYHKTISDIHFVNPGSVGRMFDANPTLSCAIIEIIYNQIKVKHFRISYPVSEVIERIKQLHLPEIYCRMYSQGRKLN